ncbi:unnamed protein product, partial [Phaeothamnion confervicola]
MATTSEAKKSGGRAGDQAWDAFEILASMQKGGRKKVKCLGCSIVFDNCRSTKARQHVHACSGIPEKAEIIRNIAASVPGSDVSAVRRRSGSAKKRKAEGGASSGVKSKSLITNHFINGVVVSKQMADEINFYILRAIVTGGVPFRFLDNVYFMKIFDVLTGGTWCPVGKRKFQEFGTFLPVVVFKFFPTTIVTTAPPSFFVRPLRAGASTMRGDYLFKEMARVQVLDRGALERAIAVTIVSNGWTDRQGRSIIAVLAVTEQREVHVLSITDYSDSSHTGEFMAGIFTKAVRHIGPRKVAAICTDGASNMRKGRDLFVQQEEHKHILDVRCQLHGFNLLFGSVFAAPNPEKPELGVWEPQGKDVMHMGQHIITFFNASHIPCEKLRQAATSFGYSTTALATSNKTRFTSNFTALDSVIKLEAPLQLVYTNNPQFFSKKPLIAAVLQDR